MIYIPHYYYSGTLKNRYNEYYTKSQLTLESKKVKIMLANGNQSYNPMKNVKLRVLTTNIFDRKAGAWWELISLMSGHAL